MAAWERGGRKSTREWTCVRNQSWGAAHCKGGTSKSTMKTNPTSHFCLWKGCFVRFLLGGRPYLKQTSSKKMFSLHAMMPQWVCERPVQITQSRSTVPSQTLMIQSKDRQWDFCQTGRLEGKHAGVIKTS